MGLLELFLIAVGLSMDAFAVAICKGLCMKKCTWGKGAIVGGGTLEFSKEECLSSDIFSAYSLKK